MKKNNFIIEAFVYLRGFIDRVSEEDFKNIEKIEFKIKNDNDKKANMILNYCVNRTDMKTKQDFVTFFLQYLRMADNELDEIDFFENQEIGFVLEIIE